MPTVSDVRIGLLGLGTVGAGVVKILQTRRAPAASRAGATLTLAAIADTDLTRPREGLDLRALPLVGDAARVLDDASIHVVVELVGGLEPARTFILRALAAGKHVVTANKALLAHHGAELDEEARRRGVALAFEAAVAGGIPLIRAVKEGLVANRVLSLAGILGDNDISIANVIQKGRGTREAVPVVMLTHEARERDMRAALGAIDRMPDVAAATTMIRVEAPA